MLAHKLGTSLGVFLQPSQLCFLKVFFSRLDPVIRIPWKRHLWLFLDLAVVYDPPLDLAITAVVQFGDHQLLSYLYANPQNSVTLTHHSPRTLTKSTRWTAWYHTPCRGGGMDKPGAGIPRFGGTQKKHCCEIRV